MSDSQKNHELLIELKTQQDKIWKELVGEPELGRKGVVKRLERIETEIEEIKKRGVRVKYFWMGTSAAAGAAAGIGGKSLWAKIAAAIASLKTP